MSRKIFLALLTFIISFILLDRYLAQKPSGSCTIYQPDRLFGQSLIPNSKCQEKTSEYEVLYKINSLGLRDYERGYEKEEGTFRLLFLGDSFTQGIGVNLEDTMAKKLEAKLNETGGLQIETVNGGIAAASPAGQYSFLVNKGINFHPDMVIFNLNTSDFLEEIAARKYSLQYEQGQMVFNIGQKRYLPESIESYLENHSLTYQIIWANRLKLLKLTGKVTAYLMRREPPDYVYSGLDAKPGDPKHDLFEITRDIGSREFEELFDPATKRISDINIFLKERKIPLLLVFIPHGHQISPTQWVRGREVYKLTENEYPTRLNVRLQQFAQSAGIDFLDLSRKFKDDLSVNSNDKIYFDYDGHLTTLGNQLAADAIYDYILNNKLLIGIN